MNYIMIVVHDVFACLHCALAQTQLLRALMLNILVGAGKYDMIVPSVDKLGSRIFRVATHSRWL